ncbi:hypothetical protein [Microbacterium sp.]|uniref:hypothetical protein n=1 Tax=Microbacterium sp. TaxID=51671 RepID=UPI0032427CA1
MSTATRDAITEAIRAHAEDEWGGDLIIDWVVTAATIDTDGDYGHGTIYSRDPAPSYVIRGLLGEALAHIDKDDN